jgi:hypothetical protein
MKLVEALDTWQNNFVNYAVLLKNELVYYFLIEFISLYKLGSITVDTILSQLHYKWETLHEALN